MTLWTQDIATRACKPMPLALLIGLGAIVGAMFASDPAVAQSYPSKEIKFVVPFPPGGITDLNARILAKHLSKFWGQPVTVSNMAGGGGTDGTMFVLGSPKDGYTMMMSATGQGTQNPAIDSKLPYKWDEPTLVARTSISPLVFVVKGDSPWGSLREVVDDVKKDPAKYKYGTSGPGAWSCHATRRGRAARGGRYRPHRLCRAISGRDGAAACKQEAQAAGCQHVCARQAAAQHAHLEGGGF
jgi:tripartite-type tricarboxylate transporter receptor subunit TctC